MSDCEEEVPLQAKIREVGRINSNSGFGPSITSIDLPKPENRFNAELHTNIVSNLQQQLSQRSDITAPTIVEPQAFDGIPLSTALNPSDASRQVRSIHCAPLQPRRREDIPCQVQYH